MKNKKIIVFLVVLAVVISAFFLVKKNSKTGSANELTKEINPTIGTIRVIISTTGTVLPKNRLAIKPPVNGRVDSILVHEGDMVTIGQTLAWMSSIERAALLDAARAQGEAVVQYWQRVYKGIPLLSPIGGEVIVATVQPGQTVTTNDPVMVISDHLIIRAQVDETDIGKISVGQKAVVSLDAYPNNKIAAIVEHMYYESKTVNNVTIYEVDLVPEIVPPFFRSGMNASIDFVIDSKENILVIPVEAVQRVDNETFVMLHSGKGKGSVKRQVSLGISDDKNIEVLSGLNEDDAIVVKSKKYALPKSDTGTNPFMPGRKKPTQPSSGQSR
ncbi:MAG: HlyD family efflux transporter periplasmic adaptor subunit [Candidatus Omnitrophota bacterium]